jgi:uncharacterized membrane protein
MSTARMLSVIVLMFAFATAFYFYPFLPSQMASHWNMEGNVNGHMDRFWGAFLLPFLMLILTILFFFLPNLDPEKKNIEKFWGEYDRFIVAFNLFMLYLYVLTIFWNLHYPFNMNTAMMPALAFLFYFVGRLVGKAKRNYMIGIRLPWSLADDSVWDKTHKAGEQLFKLTALVVLLGTFFSQYAAWFLFVPLFVSIIYLCLFSYLEYQKVKK